MIFAVNSRPSCIVTFPARRIDDDVLVREDVAVRRDDDAAGRTVLARLLEFAQPALVEEAAKLLRQGRQHFIELPAVAELGEPAPCRARRFSRWTARRALMTPAKLARAPSPASGLSSSVMPGGVAGVGLVFVSSASTDTRAMLPLRMMAALRPVSLVFISMIGELKESGPVMCG